LRGPDRPTTQGALGWRRVALASATVSRESPTPKQACCVVRHWLVMLDTLSTLVVPKARMDEAEVVSAKVLKIMGSQVEKKN